jgi:hypothetical protein
MFVSKARDAPLSCRLLALPTSIILGWNCLPGTNTLPYFKYEMFWARTEGRYFEWTNTPAYFATKVEDEDEEVFCMKTSDHWKKKLF